VRGDEDDPYQSACYPGGGSVQVVAGLEVWSEVGENTRGRGQSEDSDYAGGWEDAFAD